MMSDATTFDGATPSARPAPARAQSAAGAASAISPVTLKQREHQVLLGVCEGLTNRQIGTALGISHRTVEIYRASAYAKIGAHNTATAIRAFEPYLAGQPESEAAHV